ncbi:hypothetical protein [Aureispira sp. CCB-QB1]|uniref:hypothetical protein n=1 Tax=Aureispira sp. CCB-QB1 TaxID=1313421 RepID=UPI0006970350|nr:hypothetical protein [Aureispira sp. CCB-QB1]
MPTKISRQALEKVYENSLEPFLKGLIKMAKEFDNLFASVEFPEISLQLLDSLDSTLYYSWQEFVIEQNLGFELEVSIHFNRLSYVLEWEVKDSYYHKRIEKDYDSFFSTVEQLDYINELGRFIIDQVKEQYK